MAETKMRIKIRRDVSTQWTSVNPLLLIGEQGYETDTGKMKVGDGSSRWNSLPYFGSDISETEGNIPTTRVDIIDSTINKLKLLKSYNFSVEVETQNQANTLVIDAIVDADGRVQSIEDLDIENNYATNVSVDSKIAIEAKARYDYDEYLYNLRNQDKLDLDELKENAVRRTGDTMSGGLKIANDKNYKLEVIPESDGRPAGTARFTFEDRTQAELFWSPEDEHLKFSFPTDNRILDQDVMLELGKDALSVYTKTDIQGDLFVKDVDVLKEIEKVKAELVAELLGLSVALKTKYNKEGGTIFGPVEVKPNGSAGLTLLKVTGDGAECPLPPVNDFSLTNKRYVDTTTVPFNLRRLESLPN